MHVKIIELVVMHYLMDLHDDVARLHVKINKIVGMNPLRYIGYARLDLCCYHRVIQKFI